MLLKPIELEEVEAVVKQMVNEKSPRPNGFSTNLFHACQDWLKEEVWALVEDSRNTSNILKALNVTFLALIPKENGTEDTRKLSSITLCNAIYKIISKVIANRFRPMLPILISPKQTRFVEGRQILDGIILVHETIHSLKIGEIPGMLLKLDLSKAYDKLNWKFLSGILRDFNSLTNGLNGL